MHMKNFCFFCSKYRFFSKCSPFAREVEHRIWWCQISFGRLGSRECVGCFFFGWCSGGGSTKRCGKPCRRHRARDPFSQSVCTLYICLCLSLAVLVSVCSLVHRPPVIGVGISGFSHSFMVFVFNDLLIFSFTCIHMLYFFAMWQFVFPIFPTTRNLHSKTDPPRPARNILWIKISTCSFDKGTPVA